MKNPNDKLTVVSSDSSNDGIKNEGLARGQTLITAYGKDSSGLKGSSEGEQGKTMKNTGMSKSLGK